MENNHTDKIRAFIAIDLPPQTKEKIYKSYKKFTKTKTNISWVKPENLHITLVFLGNLYPREIKKTIEVISSTKINSNLNPSDTRATIDKVGFFPIPTHPKVVWYGFSKKPLWIEQLYSDICNGLRNKRINFDIKKEFIPHITIARVKKSLGEIVFSAPHITTQLSEITLFQSKLSPSGARYIKLFSKQLKEMAI